MGRGARAWLGIVVVAGCLATASPADAGTKVVFPSSCTTVDGGVTIDKPGKYRFERTVLNCQADPIVSIESDDVTLDLGGRLLDGDGSCTSVIRVAGGLRDVVVRNGTASDCSTGVASFAKGATITEVLVRGAGSNGIESHGLAANNVVVDSNFGLRVVGKGTGRKNTIVGGGIGADGDEDTLLESNVIVANETYGVYTPGVARKNIVAANDGEGFSLGAGAVIEQNKIRANIGDGVYGEDVTIRENAISGNTGVGVKIESTGSVVADNTVDGNTLEGITVSADPNTIRGNLSRGNLSHGIQAATDPTINANHTLGNTGFGISAPMATCCDTNRSEDNTVGYCDPSSLCAPEPPPASTPVTLSCPTTLVLGAPGHYRLTRSVSNCAASPAIAITSSDVTLDLEGRRIDGMDNFGSFGIDVDDGLSNVTVRDGVVEDFFVGVAAGSGTGIEVRDIVAMSNLIGIAAKDGATVTGCTAAWNGALGSGAGVSVEAGAVVDRCVVVANQVGISTPVGGATITDNIIAGNSGRGIDALSANTITGNRVIGSGETGIWMDDGNDIRDNVVIGNGRFLVASERNGILGDANNTVVGNVVKGNFEVGIGLNGAGAIVRSNRVTGNLNHGIYIDAVGPVVRDNVSNGNGEYGISTGPSAKINGNTASGNVNFGIVGGAGTTGSGNTAKHNGAGACVPPSLC